MPIRTFHFNKFPSYGEGADNVFSLVGKNCIVNQSISTKMSVPLIGCVMYRFQLTGKEYLRSIESIVKMFNELMKRLKTPVISSKIELHCERKWKFNYGTRCSYNFKTRKWTRNSVLTAVCDPLLRQSGYISRRPCGPRIVYRYCTAYIQCCNLHPP